MVNKRDMLHYKECGLDNIWLANGFQFVETDHGEGVMISNLGGLHRAIGMALCKQEKAMSGTQFRFLRKEMDLSQAALAELLELKTLTVANYEKGRSKRGIPKPIDVVMRSLYLEYIKKDSPVTRMMKRIADLDSHKVAASFRFNRGRWSLNDPVVTH